MTNKPNRDYFMGYAATTGAILYCKQYQKYSIQIVHHKCFDDYNSRLSSKNKHTTGYLKLQQHS